MRLLKQDAVILNFARYGIVDDAAVLAGLDSGKVQGYICDFPNNLIKDHPKVIALPHIGASTEEAEENCAVMVAEQVRDYLENGNVRNSVNFPEVAMPRAEGCCRLAVVNANVPNMVGQITSDLGAAGININDILNRSRGELAYTLMDVNNPVSPEILAQIRAIPGVLAVRNIG
jgi:D-3-phosphoglycerate dehydrogenase